MIHGFEADLALDLGRRWSIFSWAAFARGEVDLGDGAGSEPMSRIPPLNGLAGVRFNLPEVAGFVQLGLRWAARQDRLSGRDSKDLRICPDGPDGCDGTAPYGLLSLRAAARPADNILLTLALENLTNASYRTHGSGIDGPGLGMIAGLEVTAP